MEGVAVSVCKNGINRMPKILVLAPGDIRQRLWTLYWLARLVAPGGIIVELGVRNGDSTRALLAACEDSGSALYSYDVEDVGQHVRIHTGNAGIPWFDALWYFQVKHSVDAGTMWGDVLIPVDMVFVDTDHTFRTTRNEIAVWHRHVRVGGCMAFHDYWLHDPPREDEGHGVKMAVDEFADAHGESWRLETHDACGGGDTGFAILWRIK